MNRTTRIGIALLAATLAACASTPPTLVALPAPSPRETVVQTSGQNSATTVLLRPVLLPGYLENYPVVIGRHGNALIVSKDAEWAEPLRDGVARVLRDALSQHLGASRVVILGDGRRPDADLIVEFLALDPRQGALQLDARWVFGCTARDRRGEAGRIALEVPFESTNATAVAEATSEAIARLAGVLASQAECVRDSGASRSSSFNTRLPIPLPSAAVPCRSALQATESHASRTSFCLEADARTSHND